MKKQLKEIDFIGGQGSLTKEEQSSLSQYFSKKKAKAKRINKSTKTKSRELVNA